MKIYSLSKILAFPLVIWFSLVLYFTFESSNEYLSYWLIPPVILLAIIYVLNPQIDFWWHKRQPPVLDEPILKWLHNYSAFYNALTKEARTSFENRLSLFIQAKEFLAQGSKQESVPEDLKAILSHQAIQISFGLKDFLLRKYTRFIVYKHPFPSPRQQYLHCVEVHHEDGAIIYSLEQLIPGILNPSIHFNIGLYAIADAWLNVHPIDGLVIPDSFEEEIPNLVKFNLGKMKALTGEDFFNREAAFICLYFNKAEELQKLFPSATQKISQALQQNLAL
jgi:hypothetical protein